MANMLETGVSWLSSQLQSAAGQRCIYVVGDEQIEIDAIPAKPQAVVDGEQVSIVDANAMDFVIDPKRIALIAGVTEPTAGHQIKRWLGGTEETYVVRPPAAGMKCYETVDSYGVMYRVHTKRITTD